MGTRTQAQRDAITVEIGYAVVTAAFAAAAVLALACSPLLLPGLPDAARRALPFAGAALAGVVFVARVVRVLWRFPRRSGD